MKTTMRNANADKIKGKAKELEGRLTGDRVRQVQGAFEKTKGNVEGEVASAKYRAQARRDEAKAKRSAKRAR